MWRWRARMMMVKTAKKMSVWMKIAFPLVRKLPKSIGLCVPGSSNSRPGEKSTNNTTPTTTGAQSAISSPSLCCYSFLEERCWCIASKVLVRAERNRWMEENNFWEGEERRERVWAGKREKEKLSVKRTVRILILLFDGGNQKWKMEIFVTFLRVDPNIFESFWPFVETETPALVPSFTREIILKRNKY